MFSDNQNYPPYSQLMADNQPYITLDLDLKNPVELTDFVGFFGAVSNQFDRYMRY